MKGVIQKKQTMAIPYKNARSPAINDWARELYMKDLAEIEHSRNTFNKLVLTRSNKQKLAPLPPLSEGQTQTMDEAFNRVTYAKVPKAPPTS